MRFVIRVWLLVYLAASCAWAGSTGLPPGAAKVKIETTCTQCHSIKTVTKQHQDKKWWAKTLDRMVEHGLEIDPAEQEQVLRYLSTNFGVKSAGGKKAGKR